MNELCGHARSVLSSLLLLGMLQAWVLTTDNKTEYTVAEDLSLMLRKSEFDPLLVYPENIRHFKESSEQLGDLKYLTKMPLAVLVSITDADVASIHVNPEAIIRIEQAPISDDDLIVTGDSPAQFIEHEKARLQDTADRTQAGFLESLKRVRNAIEQSGLDVETMAVHDLPRNSVKVLEIPFIKQNVEFHVAFWILGSASTLVLWFLFAIVDSIKFLAVRHSSKESFPELLDCIFFYPSRMALIFGSLWIGLTPALLIDGLFYIGGQQSSFWDYAGTFGLIASSGLIVITTFSRILTIRKVQSAATTH
jgi:hypothetical protein